MHVSPFEQADFPNLRTAVATLLDVALASLAASEGTPTFTDQLDNNGWRRFGQREFGARKRDTWSIPTAVSTLGWLDRFPAMQSVREAILDDPILSKRVDCGVGVEFSNPGSAAGVATGEGTSRTHGRPAACLPLRPHGIR
jgi:hypothetical protein